MTIELEKEIFYVLLQAKTSYLTLFVRGLRRPTIFFLLLLFLGYINYCFVVSAGFLYCCRFESRHPNLIINQA